MTRTLSRKEAISDWEDQGIRHGWRPPPRASWVWRRWGIRHIRVIWLTLQVTLHYEHWAALGMLNTGYDDWVIWGIAKGVL
jgi:hypothetical protein